ncbi:hypothetical protein [Streptomyces sp. MN13]
MLFVFVDGVHVGPVGDGRPRARTVEYGHHAVAAHAGRDGQTCGAKPLGNESRGTSLVTGEFGILVECATQPDQLTVDLGCGLIPCARGLSPQQLAERMANHEPVTYLADGELQLHFELGFGYDPAGAQPGLLRPALEAAGVIPPEDGIDDLLGEDERLSPVEEKRRVLKIVGEHFGLALPQQVIESGRLPAVVTRTSPPSSW